MSGIHYSEIELFSQNEISRASLAAKKGELTFSLEILNAALTELETQPGTHIPRAKIKICLADILNRSTHAEAHEAGLEFRREQAADLATEALELLGERPNTEHIRARALGAIGISQWYIHGPHIASNFFSDACELLKSVCDHYSKQYAETLQNLALCNHISGNYDQAKERYEEALLVVDAHHLEAAQTDIRRRFANLLGDMGKFHLAAEMLDTIRPPVHLPGEDQIRWLHARALVGWEAGDVWPVDALFDEIHRQFEEMPIIGPELGAALTNASMFKLEYGSLAHAKLLLQIAERVDQTNAPFSFKINFLKAKTNFSLQSGNAEDAFEFLEKAGKLIEQSGQDIEEQRIELLLLEIAAAAQSSKRIDFDLKLSELLGVDNSIAGSTDLTGSRLDGLVILASELVVQNPESKRLKDFLQLALMEEARRGKPDLKWMIFNSLGRLLSKYGRKKGAILCYKLAVQIICKMVKPLPFNTPQRKATLTARKEPFFALNAMLVELGRFTEAQTISGLLRLNTSSNIAPFPVTSKPLSLTVPFTDRELEQVNLYWENAELARKSFNQTDISQQFEQDNWNQDQLDQFFKNLWSEPNSNDGTGFSPIAGQMEFPAAPSGTGVLRFVRKGELVYALLTCGTETNTHILDARHAEIAHHIHDLYESISNCTDDWKTHAAILHNLILEPLRADFSELSVLEIVSEGVFSQLPFAVLHDGSAFLTEKVALAYRTSVPDEADLKAQNRDGVLAVGASGAVDNFPSLPHVDEELACISNKCEKSLVLENGSFTSENLAKALKIKPNIVHVATHFQLAPGSPEKSFLLLGNGEKLSISMLASETFDWEGIELVFLSACETGTPDFDNWGGGTIAAYLQSLGALSTIATLWPVIDKSTVKFVHGFYEALSGGASPTGALQAAQIKMLARSKNNRNLPASMIHPIHWAGFKIFVTGM